MPFVGRNEKIPVFLALFLFSMAADVNQIQLIGYLTQDVEVRNLPSGIAVTDLNVQVKSRFQKEDGSEGISTSFHTVTVWGQSATFVGQYSRKGSQVYISGRLKTDSWEDDQGQKKWKTKVVADRFGGVVLLDPRVPLSPLDETFAVSGGLNRADVLGNMVKDPEMRQTPGGRTVVNFSVATNRKWKDSSGEEKEDTEFHNIVAWGRLAEDTEKIVKKGQRVFVSGALNKRSWETPAGEKRYATEIIAEQVLALGHPTVELGTAGIDESAGNEPSSRDRDTGPDINLPEINYESEIKPEDLPF